MQTLIDHGIEIEDTGFSVTEIDILLEDLSEQAPPSAKSRREEQVPELDKVAVTRCGDVWQLGRHRLRRRDLADLGGRGIADRSTLGAARTHTLQ